MAELFYANGLLLWRCREDCHDKTAIREVRMLSLPERAPDGRYSQYWAVHVSGHVCHSPQEILEARPSLLV